MDSQNPECNLHVESQRNSSLENELFGGQICRVA